MSILPTNCPICDYELEWTDTMVDLMCHNPSCEAKSIRKVLHFFQCIDNIDHFGPKTIEILLDNAYNTLPIIYNMSYNDFRLCGFGPKQSFNLGSELEYSRTRPIEEHKFLAALGIENLGIGNSKKLLKEISLNAILFHHISEDIISNVDGFGSLTSKSIVKQLTYREEEIFDIWSIGFNVVKPEVKDIINSVITEKYIVFTGKMENNRKDMIDNAIELGAIAQSSVNKKTNYLVIGETVGQNKINKAKEIGTIILTEKEYNDLLRK